MRGLTRYEKLTLVLTALFLAVCGGHFLSQRIQQTPVQLSTTRSETEISLPGEENGWPDSLLPGEQINLNTACAADLTRLPQIGQARAQAIVDWREEHGPFRSIEDVMLVKGIGEGIFGQIQAYITVNDVS